MGRRNEGNSGIVDQKVVVSGVGSLLKFGSSSDYSYVGVMYSGVCLEARDGGTVVKTGKELVIGNAVTASNNVVRAVGAGTMMDLGTIAFGVSSAAHHNRIEALDGATMNVGYISFKSGDSNGMVCSNATLNVTQYVQTSDTNSYLRVQGNHPKAQLSISGKQYSLKRGFRLIFDLPPDGYAYETADECPVVSYATSDAIDSTTVIEINGIKEYQRGMCRRKLTRERIKLAYLNNNDWWGQINAPMLAIWNAHLPEGAELSSPMQATDPNDVRGRVLYLTLTAPAGTMVLFR